MRPLFFRSVSPVRTALALVFMASAALSEPSHGIAMYGQPALPPDFVSLPYARPDAPKGGRLVEGNTGGFDSLNPFIRKGTVPWQLRFYAYESLMARSMDEPFTLYGLLAESVETPPDRSWVEFTLRPQARFSDGSPVTVEDVIWSYETLGTQGHPRYLGFQQKVAGIEQTGPRSLRITFNTEDRELALIAGLRPILKKSQWEGRDFTASTIHDVPIGSAPYVVTDYEQGRYVRLTRNPDYWGRDLPMMRGLANLDELRIEFFGDDSVLFEAFKSQELTFLREFNAETWASAYDFPAVTRGDVVKSEIMHQRPSGMTGYVMNTRRPPFDDWRVREAMIQAFNFAYINDTLTGGRQARISSYFSGSELGLRPGPATGAVADLLAPFADTLLPGTIEGYTLPQGDPKGRNRTALRRATALLQEAGWTVQDGVLKNAQGIPFRFEVLLRQGDATGQSIFEIYRPALERLGIDMRIALVDNAQHAARETEYDFDMMFFRRDLSLSPGNEQKLYWGAAGVDQPGTRNLMGMNSPAAEAMIDTMLTAPDRASFAAAVQALDRILTAGRYVIPIWSFGPDQIAHARQLKFPENIPIYGGRNGWSPDVWWYEE